MIRENVLPQIVKKNLEAIFVARSLAILTEVSASDERTKIIADRLLVKADELAARAASISGGFIENPVARSAAEKEIGKTETRALKLASVPPITDACTRILKACRKTMPEPGSREAVFVSSLAFAGNNAKFATDMSEFLSRLISAGKLRFLLSSSDMSSLSGFFAYSSEFFGALADAREVDYFVTTLAPVLTDIIGRKPETGKRVAAQEKAIILAAEVALKRIDAIC